MILGLTNHIIVLDAETGSEVNLPKEGMYRYWAHPSTRTFMLAARSLGGTHDYLYDFERDGDRLDDAFLAAAAAPPEEVMFAAANCEFDRLALRERGVDTPMEKWIDILVLAYIHGFSGRLDDVLRQTPVDFQKNSEGRRCITTFSEKLTPWHQMPHMWDKFRSYCIHDAFIEERLLAWLVPILSAPPVCYRLHDILRQELAYRKFNARGLPVDRQGVAGAKGIIADAKIGILQQMKKVTGLPNPNSRNQLLEWLQKLGSPITDLQKATVRDETERLENDLRDPPPGVLADPVLRANAERTLKALILRQAIGKSSVEKFIRLDEQTCEDSRFRGGWQFYGAARTGRVAGRVLNPANLRRPDSKISNPDGIAIMMSLGRADVLQATFPGFDTLDLLSSALRASLEAPEGMAWCVADLTSIESVGSAWLAGCDTVLDIFFNGHDTYKTFASKAEKIPYGDVTKAQRSFAKPCLAADTQVLTKRGWISIVNITLQDRLWDGDTWVGHDGLIFRGTRPVMSRGGITATLDHEFLDAERWVQFKDLENEYFNRDNASVYGKSCATWINTEDVKAYAQDAGLSKQSAWETSVPVNRKDVTSAGVPTFDLLNAGPNRRFTVKTKNGTAIASNCVLGAGYKLSALGLVGYAASMGTELSMKDAQRQINVFREEYHEITHYWWQLENAAREAIKNPGTSYHAYAVDEVVNEGEDHRGRVWRDYNYKTWPYVTYWSNKQFLYCILPSGRSICYYKPRIGPNTITMRDGHSFTVDEAIWYWGNDQKATGVKWKEIAVHAGHLLENCTQAICRDALWDGGMRQLLEDPRFEVLGDVYDEIPTLIDIDNPRLLETMVGYLTTKAFWMDDRFYLGADGYVARRYRKEADKTVIYAFKQE